MIIFRKINLFTSKLEWNKTKIKLQQDKAFKTIKKKVKLTLRKSKNKKNQK